MSNKVLAYILIVVVLVLAAGFVIWRIKANKSTGPLMEQNQTPNSQQPAQNPEAAQQAPSSTPTPAPAASCQRDFNENTLKSAKVNIQNRQVELDVKDFGKITLELYDKDAPKTVENFLRLVNAGYYDCLTFHRVAKGFVIQGGDPTGTGSGGDSAFGGPFADELNSNTSSYKAGYVKGVLAMANSGPNTNTSQFFVMLGDVELPHNYTIFGKVASGQDTVDKIGQVDIIPQMGETDGKPVKPVVIQSAKIIK